MPGYESVIWLGVIAPKGTPPAVVNRLNAEIAKIVNRPEVRGEWAKQGASAMTMPPDEFSRYVARRHREVGKGDQGLRREAGPVTD